MDTILVKIFIDAKLDYVLISMQLEQITIIFSLDKASLYMICRL